MTTKLTPNAIPSRIWEQDHMIWRAWIEQLNASLPTIAQYKRAITDFYLAIDGSITETTETDVKDYETVYRALGWKAATVTRDMRIIRAYRDFANQQQSEVL